MTDDVPEEPDLEELIEDEPDVPLPPRNDRDILRWACREQGPCGVALPGRGRWGRSFFVGLREGGPRPVLAIAQPRAALLHIHPDKSMCVCVCV